MAGPAGSEFTASGGITLLPHYLPGACGQPRPHSGGTHGMWHHVQTLRGVLEHAMDALHAGPIAGPCLSLVLCGRLHAVHACIFYTPSMNVAWQYHGSAAWGATAPRLQRTYQPITT
jgi:hypothetical protein